MKIESVCVLGGTGFVGRHLVAQLANSGRRVSVLTRHRERNRGNLVHPSVDILAVDVRDPKVLAQHFRRVDAVVFLPGILNETRHHTFRDVHIEFPRQVADACVETKVARLLHMSALNADTANGASEYLRSKGQGEDIMHLLGARIPVTSFRPSVIFGRDDSLFNRFADLLALSPIVPLACPNALFAPVYVGDVAAAFVAALENEATFGKRLELCGPDALTLRELVDYISHLLGKRRMIVPLSDGMSALMANVLQFVPGKPLTPDNLRSMKLDSVCKDNGFRTLGITPTTMDAVMAPLLQGHNKRARYYDYQRLARRD
jgi:NADH dehydrogenase